MQGIELEGWISSTVKMRNEIGRVYFVKMASNSISFLSDPSAAQ